MCICDSYLCFIELSSLSWTGGPCVPYRAQMQSKHVTTIAKRFTIKWQFYYFYLHRPLSLLAGAFPTEMGTNTITANSTTTPICCGERSVWKNLGFIYSFRFNVNTKPKHPFLLIKKKKEKHFTSLSRKSWKLMFQSTYWNTTGHPLYSQRALYEESKNQ